MERPSEAQRLLDDLAQGDFSSLPFDQEWLYGMSLLAETSVLLGDADACAHLYRLLQPWHAFNAVDVAEGFRGSVARYLGLLATATGRLDDAQIHFEEALARNEEMLARPWLARTQSTTRRCSARGISAATRTAPSGYASKPMPPRSSSVCRRSEGDLSVPPARR
jgi:hypothetical protein